MQFRHGTIDTERDSSVTPQMRQYVDGKYYGFRTNGEHYAFWHVLVDGKSASRLRYCCGYGGSHAYAMYTCDNCTMESRRTGEGDEYASTHQ